jgi:Ca2+-binding EF-hand superfamily protein
MANYMSCEMELNGLKGTFLKLDSNHDGFLNREELIEGYANLFIDKSDAEKNVNGILDQVDINLSG